jgi:DNA-binding MarR family transcriptional regulator
MRAAIGLSRLRGKVQANQCVAIRLLASLGGQPRQVLATGADPCESALQAVTGHSKLVNMTDQTTAMKPGHAKQPSNRSRSAQPFALGSRPAALAEALAGPPPRTPQADAAVEQLAFVELLFFAYRDFISDPDAVLADYGFGRAHHRVLHFVSRQPGLRVADLLDILKITKQSLGPVLKQLVDRGFVRQTTGDADRRERRLHLTAAGQDLAGRLRTLQTSRVAAALTHAAETNSTDATAAARAFLIGMITQDERAAVTRLLEQTTTDPNEDPQ